MQVLDKIWSKTQMKPSKKMENKSSLQPKWSILQKINSNS